MEPGMDAVSPDEAFWLLGEETRPGILRAVWDGDDGAPTFTELRERVGNPDSGQFNYHLDKLKGSFLAEGETGYELTQAGREVVRAVMAGTLTRQPETSPEPIDGKCVECGGGLVARYDEYGIVECGDCGVTVMWNEFPPAGLEGRNAIEFAEAFDRWIQHRFRLAMDGICPNCAGEMSMEVRNPDAAERMASLHRCSNCKYEARVPLSGHVLHHPAVVSHFYREGIDVTALPYWRWRELAEEFEVAVSSTEPWRVSVEIETGGRTLELALDDRLDVDTMEVSDG